MEMSSFDALLTVAYKTGRILLRALKVARVLKGWGGERTPTHDQLASATRQSVSSVRRALDDLRDARIVGWQNRFIVLSRACRRQISNRYVLLPSSMLLLPGASKRYNINLTCSLTKFVRARLIAEQAAKKYRAVQARILTERTRAARQATEAAEVLAFDALVRARLGRPVG